MILKKRSLEVISLGYIYIPILIFLIRWTNMIVAATSLIAIGCVAYRYWKNITATTQNDGIKIECWVVVCVILFFAWIGYYAGWGRWVTQTYDWEKHNAVLRDLVNRNWPVYYTNGEEHSMLVYYIAHYLVPASVGKLFHHSYRIAEIAFYFWTEIGLLLVYFNLVRVIKIENHFLQVGSAFLLVFWGTPLWLSELLLKRVSGINMLGSGQWFFSGEGIALQYSNNFVLLRWVVPQVVTIWLMLLMFWENKEKIEYYLFLLIPAILFGTLAFISIVPIAMACAVEGGIKNRSVRKWLAKIFSLENIVILLTLGSVFFLYFYGNVLTEKPVEMSLMMQPYAQHGMLGVSIYAVFVLVNVVIYAVILIRDNYKDSIFVMAVASLCVLPMFKMGLYNDLGMRGSIPGLFFLMLYIIKYLNEHLKINKEKWTQGFATTTLIFLIMNGMFYSFAEFSDSVTSENYSTLGDETEWESLEMFANREAAAEVDLKYNYYAYNIEDNVFQRFIARKHF